MVWRWAAASSIGTSHTKHGCKSQDAYAVSELGKNHIFAVVSDGAGSAEFGAYGAWLVCRNLKVWFRHWFKDNEVLPNDEALMRWLDDLRVCISKFAEQRNTTPRQFAATLAALIVSSNDALAVHIGDSAIVGRSSSEWEIICLPESGEYASSTFFVTDEPKPLLNIVRKPCEHDAFALFTDGIGEIALSLHNEPIAYPGFFEPIIKPVDASTETGRLRELSQKLRIFLSGSAVCQRTDDDKTLILLSEM